MSMQETLSIVSLLLSMLSVILIIIMNWSALRKLRKAEAKETAVEKSLKLSRDIETTEFGKNIMEELKEIRTLQETYNQALLHTLRADILSTTDEIMYINRLRGTKSSKWHSLSARLSRYVLLEEIIDASFSAYTQLGGNHAIAERYHECKAIIKETKRQAEE